MEPGLGNLNLILKESLMKLYFWAYLVYHWYITYKKREFSFLVLLSEGHKKNLKPNQNLDQLEQGISAWHIQWKAASPSSAAAWRE